jgi:hypothetical protein
MIEDGVFETPRAINIRRKVEEVERATLRKLPDWLKPELGAEQLKEVQSEAATFIFNLLFIGAILIALLTGGLSRFGAAVGWGVGISLVAFMSYAVYSSYRDMDRILGDCGLALSKLWLSGSATLSLVLGAGLSLLVVGEVSAWRDSLGIFPLLVICVAVILPVLWFVSRSVVERTLTREVMG